MSTAPTPPEGLPDPPATPGPPDDGASTTPTRRWFRRRVPVPAEPAPADAPPPEAAVPPPPRPEGPRELRRTRKGLLEEREDAVYHLGGLAFELYRRDLLPHDAMRLRAGRVAEIDETIRDIDARLEGITYDRRERRRRRGADDAAGCCLVCRTTFRAEARFCWNCGTRLVPDAPGDDQPTVAITTRPVA